MISRDDLDSLWDFISSKSFTQADCLALNEPRSETDFSICSIECSWTRNVWQEKLQQISVNSECLFLFEAKGAAPFFCSTVLLCVSHVVSRKKSITVAAPTSALSLPGNGFDFHIQAILFCIQSTLVPEVFFRREENIKRQQTIFSLSSSLRASLIAVSRLFS